MNLLCKYLQLLLLIPHATMSVSDEEMLSGSDVEREMADAEVQRSAKGKAKEVLLADGAAPAPLPGAQAAHTLDNLPWCAWTSYTASKEGPIVCINANACFRESITPPGWRSTDQ